MNSRITELLQIKYPIVQAGMVWCSGWELAVAVSNSGGFGIIGAGSMPPEVLEIHLQNMSQSGVKSFGVNLPLFYSRVEEQLVLIERYKVPVVFTSAGSPALYTPRLKALGIKVVHVVSSLKFALKAQGTGVDAIVAEGFEAGGHNGREELTTLVLLEILRGKLNIPVIAAGGIASGAAIAAAFALGAEGVQIGSLFAVSEESSAHQHFKDAVLKADENATSLTLKELTPVRLLKNKLYEKFQKAYTNKAGVEELKSILGKGKSKLGIFEGDIINGELEIGQISACITKIQPVSTIMQNLITEYNETLTTLHALKKMI